MKKVFTLFFAAILFSVAAFSQERRYHNDNRYDNSYQYPSSNNGYGDSYNNDWNNGGYDHHFDRDRRFHKREWFRHRRFEDRNDDGMIFRDHGYYDNYHRDYDWHRRRFVLGIEFGGRHRF